MSGTFAEIYAHKSDVGQPHNGTDMYSTCLQSKHSGNIFTVKVIPEGKKTQNKEPTHTSFRNSPRVSFKSLPLMMAPHQ